MEKEVAKKKNRTNFHIRDRALGVQQFEIKGNEDGSLRARKGPRFSRMIAQWTSTGATMLVV